MASAPGDKIWLYPSTPKPLTRKDVQRMINTCDPDTLAGVRDRALFAVAWDTRLTTSRLATLRIEAFQHGPHDRDPLTTDTRDLLHDWLLAMAIDLREPVTTGLLFRAVTRSGHLAPHQSIRRDALNLIIERAIQYARIPHPQQYAARSLRLGARIGV